MSIQSVRAFLTERAPDIEIIELPTSTATVLEASAAHGVSQGQIAKTLSLWLKDGAALVILAGDRKIDNQKFKAQFQIKPKMLSASEVVEWTGHPVGGVCPFGLAHPLRVFADVSLKAFDEVLPAAGATNAAVKIGPTRLAELVQATWIDVAQQRS